MQKLLPEQQSALQVYDGEENRILHVKLKWERQARKIAGSWP